MARPIPGGGRQDPLSMLLLTPLPAAITVQPVITPTVGSPAGGDAGPPPIIPDTRALYTPNNIVMYNYVPNGCIHEEQGPRQTMEDDKFIVQLGDHVWFYGVLDGHGGALASKEFSDTIPKMVSRNLQGIDLTNSNDVKQAVQEAFLEVDQRWYREERFVKDGTTLTAVIVMPGYIYTVNLGDSRTLIYYKSRMGGRFTATTDHKPVDNIEKARIEAAGGSVVYGRVLGSLAVARALGDNDFKYGINVSREEQRHLGEKAMVSPIPDVERHDRVIMGESIVLACDGLWDVFTNEEIFEFIKNPGVSEGERCQTLVNFALKRGSRDNVTVMIVDLSAN